MSDSINPKSNSKLSTNKHPFTQLLADVLANPTIRKELVGNPQNLFERYELSVGQKQSLLSIVPEEIQQQAITLIDKRWHEINKLIPKTISFNPTEIQELFRFFATKFWPTGYRRHQIDAMKFIAFLEDNSIAVADPTEKKRLRRGLKS